MRLDVRRAISMIRAFADTAFRPCVRSGRKRASDDMKSAIEVLDAFENIRRAHRAGVYAPHKPLLILLALTRVRRGSSRMLPIMD
jgi:hypothetical protein